MAWHGMCSRGALAQTHSSSATSLFSITHQMYAICIVYIHWVNWRFSDLYAYTLSAIMPPFIPFRIFQALSHHTRTLTPTNQPTNHTYIQNVHDSSSRIEKTSACDAWFDSLFLFLSSSTSFCFKFHSKWMLRKRKRRITYRFIGLAVIHSELWYFWLFSLWRITDEALSFKATVRSLSLSNVVYCIQSWL